MAIENHDTVAINYLNVITGKKTGISVSEGEGYVQLYYKSVAIYELRS